MVLCTLDLRPNRFALRLKLPEKRTVFWEEVGGEDFCLQYGPFEWLGAWEKELARALELYPQALRAHHPRSSPLAFAMPSGGILPGAQGR